MAEQIYYKKIFFLGAGSTSFCKLPTTYAQKDKLIELCFKNQKFLVNNIDISSINNNNVSIPLLKEFVNDYFTKDNFDINLFYNVCDNSLQSQRELKTKSRYYTINDIKICKNTVKAIVFSLFYDALRQSVDDTKMLDFYYNLGIKAINKQLTSANEIEKRSFIFTDYAIINLNWDLLSIIPILQAHKKINEEKHFLNIDDKYAQIKLFNDFAAFMACNSKDNNDVWYPYNESVAIRTNRLKHNPERVVRLVKTFFPHGLMNLYKCRCCAKHTLNLGDLSLESLLENKLLEDEQNDVVFTCPHCGNDIHALDIDFLEQTNHKIINSYLHEIQFDMQNTLSHTDEIVFIGYSLPKDDIDYNEILISQTTNVKKVKVVLFDGNYIDDNDFYPADYFTKLNQEKRDTIKRFIDIFGKDKTLFNFSGSPNCFKCKNL